MSLFPKGYEISSHELIRQWMAQGFIVSSGRGKSMEDTGKEYFNELCWRFFCEISSENPLEDNVRMHDVMRDLAREVAGKELYVRGDPKNEYVVSKQTRHISFDYEIESWEDVVSKLQQAKGLRTLLLFTETPVEEVVLDKLFSNFLRLRGLQIRNVSKSIKRLRHLRYLNLSGRPRIGSSPLNLSHCSYVKSIPKSITELQNLQTLNLKHCADLMELPRDISNLVNLRHLLCDFKLIDKLEGMEKLTSLQALDSFKLDCKKFNKVKEFNELNCFIEFDLEIIGLEQLRSSASKANLVNLENKKGIKILRLKWELENDEYEGDGDETILEGLKPHPDVKVLRIYGYCGIGLPNWMSTSRLLTTIKILNCHRLQHLNQLSHLQALKCLYLKGLRSLVSLSEWIGSITSLEELDIVECPKLRSMPKEMQQLKSLRYLHIARCPQLQERCKKGGQDWPNISHVPPAYLIVSTSYNQVMS